MQTQTITKVQVESFMELMRKVWSTFKKNLKRMMSVVLRTFRKASIAELERRNGNEYMGLVIRSEYDEMAYPIKKTWSSPVLEELRRLTAEEIKNVKRYDKLISRLEGIQTKTRKPRNKKKLGKRICQLEFMILATSWGCRLDC